MCLSMQLEEEIRKERTPSVEQAEGVLITLALVSTGWLKMIRVPELMLIPRDRPAGARM